MKPLYQNLAEHSEKLGTAYYFRYHPDQGHAADFYLKWFEAFFKVYLKKHQINKDYSDILNCPDILQLNPAEDKNFVVDDFTSLYRFQETSALVLKHKFCLLYPMSKISESLQNKLLKILEEPYNNLVFFLFDNQNTALLPTIESRVVTLRLLKHHDGLVAANPSSEVPFEEVIKLIKTTSLPSQFAEEYKKHRHQERELISTLCSYFEQQQYPAMHTEKFLNLVNWLQQSLTYHNPISERAFFLHQFFQRLPNSPH